jgi:hypothetical protein
MTGNYAEKIPMENVDEGRRDNTFLYSITLGYRPRPLVATSHDKSFFRDLMKRQNAEYGHFASFEDCENSVSLVGFF